MSSDPQLPPEPAPPEPVPEARPAQQEVVIDLDFVPTWARQPAANPYAGAQVREERGGRDRGDRGGGRDRGGPGKGPRDDRRRGPPSKNRRDGGGRPPRGRPSEPAAPARIHLPLEIVFIPERKQLGALVRQLHTAQKAFPLSYVAGLLLAKPEYHALRVDVREGRGGAPLRLVQCASDGALFPDPESLRAHAIARHLGQFFDEQDIAVDPPTGQFTCVGRCRLTGELLGPPNYHGYNERVVDLHRTRFAHMTLDAYRAQVEVVRDPAIIEQWKESCRVQRVYRPKGQPEAPPLKREEAVAQFSQRHLPGLQHGGTRFMVPAETVREMPAGPLRSALEEAWTRENRFPLSLMLALRPAFKRMRLQLFKAGRGETFVTAIPPKPLDAAHAVENIRAMLDLIREHPGWNRARLVEHLSPGTPLASDAAAQLLSPLRWLIEKGHVIEFFNGTLSAPAPARPARAAAANPERPVEPPADAVSPEAPAPSPPSA